MYFNPRTPNNVSLEDQHKYHLNIEFKSAILYIYITYE